MRRKVAAGVMFGRTPKVVEPIKPREEEVRASVEIETPLEARSVGSGISQHSIEEEE